MDLEGFLDEIVGRIADRVASRIGERATVPQLERLIGPDDVGVSRRTWRAEVHAGRLRAVKVGRELLAKRSDFEAWLESCAVRVLEPPPVPRSADAEDVDEGIRELLAKGKLRFINGGKAR